MILLEIAPLLPAQPTWLCQAQSLQTCGHWQWWLLHPARWASVNHMTRVWLFKQLSETPRTYRAWTAAYKTGRQVHMEGQHTTILASTALSDAAQPLQLSAAIFEPIRTHHFRASSNPAADSESQRILRPPLPLSSCRRLKQPDRSGSHQHASQRSSGDR